MLRYWVTRTNVSCLKKQAILNPFRAHNIWDYSITRLTLLTAQSRRLHGKETWQQLVCHGRVWISFAPQTPLKFQNLTLLVNNLQCDSVEISFCAISHLLLLTLVHCQWVSHTLANSHVLSVCLNSQSHLSLDPLCLLSTLVRLCAFKLWLYESSSRWLCLSDFQLLVSVVFRLALFTFVCYLWG